MSNASHPAKKAEDKTVSLYIGELQQRHPSFERAQEEELRVMKHDVFARLFSEYVVFGEKHAFENMLRGMLTDAERQRLQTDQKFTRAWQIFVDLCWLKKQLLRAGLVLAGVLLLFGAVLFCVWALPHVAGPSTHP